MARPKKPQSMQQLSIFDWLKDEEKREKLRLMLSIKEPKDRWRGQIMLPPGSVAEDVINEFRQKSDIPLEIPFFQLFHLISGYLLYNGVSTTIDGGGLQKVIRPDFWTIILATSGGGKTTTWSFMEDMAPDVIKQIQWFEFNGLVSGASFIESLADNNNKLVVRDEFEQFYKRLKNPQGPLAELVEYLLLAYDNRPLSRKKAKKKGETDRVYIDKPAFSFLGMCVGSTFTDSLSLEDVDNGLLARYGLVCAERDPTRNPMNFPWYSVNLKPYKDKFCRLLDGIKFKSYICDDNALEGYATAWREMARDDIDMSFYRRILWKAHKYALIYHILTEQGDKEKLTAIDYGWAAKALQIHLLDNIKLLQQHGLSTLQKQYELVNEYCKQQFIAGKPIRASDILRSVRGGWRRVSEVRDLLSLTDYTEDRIRIR